MTDKNPIQVSDRIFRVIETLANCGPSGLIELSKKLDLNKSTVHRILNALICMGYVKQDLATSKYFLSFKICEIASQVQEKISVIDIARPFLKQLVRDTGETVHLVQMDGTSAIYIDKVESDLNTVRLVSRIGKRIPLYCSGVGKSIMAGLPDLQIKELWEQSEIQSLTPHTIVDLELFMDEINKIRRDGFAVDNEENELGVRCVAVSLKDYGGNCYAFSISAPSNRLDNEKVRLFAAGLLKAKENILSNVL